MYLYNFKCFVFANDLYAKIVTNIEQIIYYCHIWHNLFPKTHHYLLGVYFNYLLGRVNIIIICIYYFSNVKPMSGSGGYISILQKIIVGQVRV